MAVADRQVLFAPLNTAPRDEPIEVFFGGFRAGSRNDQQMRDEDGRFRAKPPPTIISGTGQPIRPRKIQKKQTFGSGHDHPESAFPRPEPEISNDNVAPMIPTNMIETLGATEDGYTMEPQMIMHDGGGQQTNADTQWDPEEWIGESWTELQTLMEKNNDDMDLEERIQHLSDLLEGQRKVTYETWSRWQEMDERLAEALDPDRMQGEQVREEEEALNASNEWTGEMLSILQQVLDNMKEAKSWPTLERLAQILEAHQRNHQDNQRLIAAKIQEGQIKAQQEMEELSRQMKDAFNPTAEELEVQQQILRRKAEWRELQVEYVKQNTAFRQETKEKLDELTEGLQRMETQLNTGKLEETVDNLQQHIQASDTELQNELGKIIQMLVDNSRQITALQQDTIPKLYTLYQELQKMQAQNSHRQLEEALRNMQQETTTRDTELKNEVTEMKQQHVAYREKNITFQLATTSKLDLLQEELRKMKEQSRVREVEKTLHDLHKQISTREDELHSELIEMKRLQIERDTKSTQEQYKTILKLDALEKQLQNMREQNHVRKLEETLQDLHKQTWIRNDKLQTELEDLKRQQRERDTDAVQAQTKTILTLETLQEEIRKMRSLNNVGKIEENLQKLDRQAVTRNDELQSEIQSLKQQQEVSNKQNAAIQQQTIMKLDGLYHEIQKHKELEGIGKLGEAINDMHKQMLTRDTELQNALQTMTQQQAYYNMQSTAATVELRALQEEIQKLKEQSDVGKLGEALQNLQKQLSTQESELHNELKNMKQHQITLNMQNIEFRQDTIPKLYALYEELQNMKAQNSNGRLEEMIRNLQERASTQEDKQQDELKNMQQRQNEWGQQVTLFQNKTILKLQALHEELQRMKEYSGVNKLEETLHNLHKHKSISDEELQSELRRIHQKQTDSDLQATKFQQETTLKLQELHTELRKTNNTKDGSVTTKLETKFLDAQHERIQATIRKSQELIEDRLKSQMELIMEAQKQTQYEIKHLTQRMSMERGNNPPPWNNPHERRDSPTEETNEDTSERGSSNGVQVNITAAQNITNVQLITTNQTIQYAETPEQTVEKAKTPSQVNTATQTSTPQTARRSRLPKKKTKSPATTEENTDNENPEAGKDKTLPDEAPNQPDEAPNPPGEDP